MTVSATTVEVPAAGTSPLAARAARIPMRPISRVQAAFAALLLSVLYVTPLWHIALRAPQYPEGLGMYIWVDRITGQGLHDLRNINGLNHYIGMKEIVPESIPELRLMPYLLAALIAGGLLAAAWGRRQAVTAWVGVFVAGLLAGLADFWRWGYDYGHNLDPHAAIKVPGMTYQPPLLGTKQLLNFQASSWPALGGWIALLALGLGAAVVLRERRLARRVRS